MNWNKLIRYSSVAFALAVVPMVTAKSEPKRAPRCPAEVRSLGLESRSMASASNRGIGSSNSGSVGKLEQRFGPGELAERRSRPLGERRTPALAPSSFLPYYGYYPFGFGYGGYGMDSVTRTSDRPSTTRQRQCYYSRRASNGGSIVVNVQQELARAGYYRGAIDGVAGDGTRRAIRSYERANGLRVDGRIDSELLSNMGLELTEQDSDSQQERIDGRDAAVRSLRLGLQQLREKDDRLRVHFHAPSFTIDLRSRSRHCAQIGEEETAVLHQSWVDRQPADASAAVHARQDCRFLAAA